MHLYFRTMHQMDFSKSVRTPNGISLYVYERIIFDAVKGSLKSL